MTAENEKSELRVEDRRNFDKDGNPIRKDDEQEQVASKDPDLNKTQQPSSVSSSSIDFTSLIFIYVQTALVHLGELAEPGQTKAIVNLDAARQVIDIIDLLRVKTSGNLTSEEEQYLEKALFDLRLLYVHKAKMSQ